MDAESAGRRCAEAGLTVITGGYGGTMEAASRGASMAGGRVIGVTAPDLFPGRPGANRYVTEEIAATSITERVGILTGRASGAIVFPGAIGTAAELMVAWNINHVARGNGERRFPTVAVGERWRALWTLLTSDMATVHDDVHLAEAGEEAVDWLLAQPETR